MPWREGCSLGGSAPPNSPPCRIANAQADLGRDIRTRIVEATAALIATGGPDAATTRTVAAAAHIQAPTIYLLFGDKRGLLDAVAQHGLTAYVAEKALRASHPDPVQELRNGWDMHACMSRSAWRIRGCSRSWRATRGRAGSATAPSQEHRARGSLACQRGTGGGPAPSGGTGHGGDPAALAGKGERPGAVGVRTGNSCGRDM